jgi:hypothetical protein
MGIDQSKLPIPIDAKTESFSRRESIRESYRFPPIPIDSHRYDTGETRFWPRKSPFRDFYNPRQARNKKHNLIPAFLTENGEPHPQIPSWSLTNSKSSSLLKIDDLQDTLHPSLKIDDLQDTLPPPNLSSTGPRSKTKTDNLRLDREFNIPNSGFIY